MANDSVSDSISKTTELINGAGNKRDSDFNELGSLTKKAKTNIENNQDVEDPTSKKAETGQIGKSSPDKSDGELCYNIEADAAEDKGSRHSMEDAWVVLHDACLDFPGALRCAYFAIFDGHAGRLAAQYAQKNLHRNVLSAGLPLGCKDGKKGHT